MKTFDEVDAILHRHQRRAPVKVVPIAREFGLAVYRDSTMEDDVSGMILPDPIRGGPSGLSIYVNDAHPVERRRFTIAHAIGHFVLHPDLIEDGVVDDHLYDSRLGSVMERQANAFAADVLMPEHLLRAAFDAGIRDPEALARRFEVSTVSMHWRLGVPA
ncbi:MAG: ImmA/IrrE family metallo-endopeptidase [Gammaproteobacteria bacterium]|jgi:hypothetical protein|nr:ImmA/IrrE family metallo-endopeptidase [Gammaproteobacteria bacterium]